MHRYRKKLTEIKVFENKYFALRHYSSILDEVSDLLKDAKISAYEKSFRDNSYDDLGQIVSMTHLQELPEHVQLLDKPGHKKDSSQPLMPTKVKPQVQSKAMTANVLRMTREKNRHQFCVSMRRLPALLNLIDFEFC